MVVPHALARHCSCASRLRSSADPTMAKFVQSADASLASRLADVHRTATAVRYDGWDAAVDNGLEKSPKPYMVSLNVTFRKVLRCCSLVWFIIIVVKLYAPR